MDAIRVQQVITKDGEILVTGLPYKVGQSVEVILLPEPVVPLSGSGLSVRRLRQSGLIGLWKDREDIQDSAVYARQLREQAQQREGSNNDFAG